MLMRRRDFIVGIGAGALPLAAHAQRAVDYLHALQSERADAAAQAAITSLGSP